MRPERSCLASGLPMLHCSRRSLYDSELPETSFPIDLEGQSIIMYREELAREARLIALGHQEFVALFAEKWHRLLDWLGLDG
jgi:hypothetical protein